jgi:hypothetical protein
VRASSCLFVVVVVVGCGSVKAVDVDGGSVDASSGADASIDAEPRGPTCYPAPAGLAARWRGEDDAKDHQGLFDGTAHGSVAYTPGRHGSAFLLDGTSAYVTADSGDVLWPTGSFSVEAWVKASTITEGSTVFVKYGCGGSSCDFNVWELAVDAAGHPAFNFRKDKSPTGQISLTDSLHDVIDGHWHHLVGVRDVALAQLRLYVDGKVAVTNPISGLDLEAMGNSDGLPDPVTIGAIEQYQTATFLRMFAGAVDDAAYYTSALGDAQVAAIYAAPDGECP